jgi:hypothetical protein
MRTLGGAVGVSALGSVMSTKVSHYTENGLARLGIHAAPGDGGVPKLSALPVPVRGVVEDSFGHGIGDVFLYAAPFAALATLAILFIKEVPLRTSTTAPVASGSSPATADDTVSAAN